MKRIVCMSVILVLMLVSISFAGINDRRSAIELEDFEYNIDLPLGNFTLSPLWASTSPITFKIEFNTTSPVFKITSSGQIAIVWRGSMDRATECITSPVSQVIEIPKFFKYAREAGVELTLTRTWEASPPSIAVYFKRIRPGVEPRHTYLLIKAAKKLSTYSTSPQTITVELTRTERANFKTGDKVEIIVRRVGRDAASKYSPGRGDVELLKGKFYQRNMPR